MFGGFAPPQFSKEELEQHETEATSTVQLFFGAAVLLYFCMLPSIHNLNHNRIILTTYSISSLRR
ncbi:hypothetical protein F4815DRAFT_466912 [Daldinia loculata]|nr:hypothetical protein F4815DRAFT_466912 [Daldinia loculata]